MRYILCYTHKYHFFVLSVYEISKYVLQLLHCPLLRCFLQIIHQYVLMLTLLLWILDFRAEFQLECWIWLIYNVIHIFHESYLLIHSNEMEELGVKL